MIAIAICCLLLCVLDCCLFFRLVLNSVVGVALCCLFLFVVDVFCLCIIVTAFRCVSFVFCFSLLFAGFVLVVCFGFLVYCLLFVLV